MILKNKRRKFIAEKIKKAYSKKNEESFCGIFQNNKIL